MEVLLSKQISFGIGGKMNLKSMSFPNTLVLIPSSIVRIILFYDSIWGLPID